MKIFNFQFSIFKNKSGFTLTELVVAIGIFLVAITIAVGGFVRALKTQRIVNHLMSVNSNASIVLEQMVREIRTSHTLTPRDLPRGSCPANFEELDLVNSKNKLVTYSGGNGAISRRECDESGCGVGDLFLPLTASNILIERLCFESVHEVPEDPWRVTLFLKVGSSNPDLEGNALNLETTISSRILPSDVQ
ncbi:MAG: type II secretion system protein [Patescibacteria group bacterium]